MRAAPAIIAAIDRCSEALGRLASWCAVLMVGVTCYVVFSGYLFDEGSVAVQESVIYLNAVLFMLSAAFTLKHNGHVRVDIFYGRAGERYRAWVDLLGAVGLLLPVCLFIAWQSWDYVLASWRIQETSGDPGGLPFVYLLKTLILIMPALLIGQGVAEILRNFSKLFLETGGQGGDSPDEGTPWRN